MEIRRTRINQVNQKQTSYSMNNKRKSRPAKSLKSWFIIFFFARKCFLSCSKASCLFNFHCIVVLPHFICVFACISRLIKLFACMDRLNNCSRQNAKKSYFCWKALYNIIVREKKRDFESNIWMKLNQNQDLINSRKYRIVWKVLKKKRHDNNIPNL